ncbi:MAG TPA: phenylalanine--tRNA ligase subunit beta [Burkholderiaceae bacterium]|nr:phenylalanine--tRNA ligase subunit beta [Burkholderiaceae bacterium]HMX10977.1 phenylalanine--tRNA ligase subunit beta [Burkholderiaceae bacterium]HMY98989.1 phenylalanine--tRNA ligase subunit beta [Burkholderiaceae bacterium]HNB43095.1 phenylalanine--tRNA ligase subunit beta [Burkholderiaceae bacterium]HNG78325.1 phenylalanine--tRNA ligase subunit beta [Burkholderiaceae bacterium]
MQFPESWLREFCNPDLSTQALADLLTMSGMEVEELRPVAPPFSGIVVAEILTADQHPNADRLRVCTVDAGPFSKDGPLQIVCGAPNARAGIKVPLATVGAQLPPGEDGKPFVIGKGKLRGVESFGMLCSARELKLSEDHGGLLELPEDAPVGQDIRAYLSLDDTLFTLKLTPNLGHCLSVFGIAREVAALTGSPLLTPAIAPIAPQHDAKLPVRIEAADLCGRFSGRVVRGIDPTAKTPQWMIDRLARCGQRPVSALVDISNYVMFEYGRPTHIFDLDKIHGGLVVRWGRAGETLKLLNGNTITLDEQVGVIADDQAVESLAGIMGGDATAVSDDTRNVYVEAAFWWPEAVAGRSRRFNFSTDAGHRFERGVDAALTVEHIERITALIQQICGGEAGPIDDQTIRLPERAPVRLRVERASKVIGMPVSQAQCIEVLERLGLAVTAGEGADAGVLTVTPPSWRFDLQIEEDLIEDVIRVIGFDRLPLLPPQAPVTSRVRPEAQRSSHALRRAVAALDYQETINFSFVEERWESELAGNSEPIRLLNPIAAPLAVMRSSLIGSLVQVLRHNLARRAPRVRVFELGRVFRRDASVTTTEHSVGGVDQPLRVAGLAWGPADQLQWGAADRTVDFFDVKGDVEALLAPRQPRFVPDSHPAMHPGRCARVELNGEVIGFVGELHPRWVQAYELPAGQGAPVLFELNVPALLARDVPNYQTVPRQQAVNRDIALIVREGVRHDDLMGAIHAAPTGGVLRGARLFDVYRPTTASAGLAADERSLAIRLELLDEQAALTDERSDEVVRAVVAAAQQAVGARLRGA